MIKLFEANATVDDFKTNGLQMLKPLKQIEIKKLSLNGWTIDVELPIKDADIISQDMIVVAKTKSKDNPQAFRIKNIEKQKRTLKFQAEHVVFDARDYYLVNVRPVKVNAHTALNYVNDRTDNPSPFTFFSDVNNTSTAYFMDKNLLEAMAIIEERWGGYYDVDNWDIKLLQDVGHDNGEIIAHGKNLEDIKVFEDWSNVVTRLYAVGFDGARFEEKYLDADITYPTPYTKRVDFETEFEDEDRVPENLIPELRENAERYLELNKYPRISYEVKSNINQNMEIGDTIHIKHPLVMIRAKVQEYEYNMITKRVKKLIFGNYSRDVKKRFDTIKDNLNKVILRTSKQEAIVHHQTDLINNMNKTGHVYQDENQIMILDKLPKEDAKKVWRWNMGGLGFSENGIEGPFKQAWTMDGVFNTDFISAGSILTNHLSSDVGASLDLTSNTAITSLVSNINQLKEDNIIPWHIGDGLEGWDGTTGELRGVENPPGIVGIKGLQGNMNAYVGESKEFKSLWFKEFFGPGEMLSPYGRIVTNDKYSFRGRIKNFKPIKITVHEYTEINKPSLKSTPFNFVDPEDYVSFSIQLLNQTNYVRIGFDIPNATLDSRVKIAELMFNANEPREYAESTIDVRKLSESYRQQTSEEITEVVKSVEIVDGKTVENYAIIQQLSDKLVLAVNSNGKMVLVELGVNPNNGSTFVVKADNISLEGLTTINGGFRVLENGYFEANKGTVGAYTLSSGSLVGNDVSLRPSKVEIGEAELRYWRASGGMSSLEAYTQNFLIGKRNREQSGLLFYDHTGAHYAIKRQNGSTEVTADHVNGSSGGVSPVTIREIKGNLRITTGSIMPDGTGVIGNTSNRFNAIYLLTQPNVSSDKRLKNNIQLIEDSLIDIFGEEVEPRSFSMNGSNEIHFGYIAQDVERALYKYNLSRYGLNRAKEQVDRFAVLSKSESYLSLLYGEIAVIMDAYHRRTNERLEKRIEAIEELLRKE